MKHTYGMSILLAICALALVASAGTAWAAMPVTVFSDDFNDGNINGWIPGPNSAWQVVGGVCEAAPTTGNPDGNIIGGVALPTAFSFDLDFGFVGDGTYYWGGAVFSSTTAGGGFGDKWLIAGIYTHPNWPTNIRANLYTSDGSYWETTTTTRAGGSYHIQADRPVGADYITLQATGGGDPLTLQTPDISWIDDLQYAGLFVWGGSGWNNYDNVSLTTVPEPGSLLALGASLAGFAGLWIRRRN